MNVDWLSRLPAPARRALYFGLQRLAGSRIGPVWREFQRWEHLAPAELEREVETKLSGVLAHATARVGYYRELNLVHRAGESARGWTISEVDAGDFEQHLVDRIL